MDTIAPASTASASTDKIDIAAHFTGVAETLERVLGGQNLRLVAFNGAGGWHKHDTASETVLVWSGRFDVEFRDRTISLGAGQCTVIAPGQEHRGVSANGAQIVLVRTAETT